MSDLARSAEFWHTVGVHEIEWNEHIVVLELRGGRHLVLLPGAPSAGADAPVQLMVEDLETTYAEWER